MVKTNGGQIIIGVDDSGSIIGIDIGKESIQQTINTIKQNTQPNIIVDIEEYTIEKTIVVIIPQEPEIEP